MIDRGLYPSTQWSKGNNTSTTLTHTDTRRHLQAVFTGHLTCVTMKNKIKLEHTEETLCSKDKGPRNHLHLVAQRWMFHHGRDEINTLLLSSYKYCCVSKQERPRGTAVTPSAYGLHCVVSGIVLRCRVGIFALKVSHVGCLHKTKHSLYAIGRGDDIMSFIQTLRHPALSFHWLGRKKVDWCWEFSSLYLSHKGSLLF